ncbi:extracellular exo [Diplodia corticola]|uniref:galacturonan 1,4-alpha-galacturonidase n=1 Tax=Diplodia corticola TaxID=236234 RepID=A0A1J9SLT5_9PEZI|nr:extracellular exo [Diplodia corticola]OJD40684.1 extracellular exo [Diplodia corticola]
MRLFSCPALPLSLYCVLTSARVIQTTLDNGRPQCTVHATGNQTDDVPAILSAFASCGNGGDIVFPEGEDYYIATRLNPVVSDVHIHWRGQWTFSPDLAYWRANSYPIAFQNHAAGFVLTGDRIQIDGHGTGGIFGNGNAWYVAEAASPVGDTQPGRPMPFVLWNVSDVRVSAFYVRDPQLWAINIMNGTRLAFDRILVNATAPAAPPGVNWVQNTDGFDTMDADDVTLTDFTYQGGDDCVAIKPRSRNVRVRRARCVGGNGVAVGSLGQYLEDASVENVVFDDVALVTGGRWLHGSALVKTWVGVLVNQSSRSYESAWVPRGAGWGSVRNVVFSNFRVEGAEAGPQINQNSGNNGTEAFEGSSLMDVSNVAYVNWTGWLDLDEGDATTAGISCSTKHPCYNIDFKNVSLTTAQNSTDLGTAECKFTEEGGVHGVEGEGC